MGTISLTTQNRLYWLGRYSERVYMNVQFTLEQYDMLIDSIAHDHVQFCHDNGIPCLWDDPKEFAQHYMFDLEYPYSIYSAVENMLGNGMVLRETISTPTLAYLQLAHNAMEQARTSTGPLVQLQWVLDDIMAFRGSLDDGIDDEGTRNIIKSAALVERISLMIRNSYHLENLDKELMKLINRLYKTDLTVNRPALDVVTARAIGKEGIDALVLLNNVENLFSV